MSLTLIGKDSQGSGEEFLGLTENVSSHPDSLDSDAAIIEGED